MAIPSRNATPAVKRFVVDVLSDIEYKLFFCTDKFSGGIPMRGKEEEYFFLFEALLEARRLVEEAEYSNDVW